MKLDSFIYFYFYLTPDPLTLEPAVIPLLFAAEAELVAFIDPTVSFDFLPNLSFLFLESIMGCEAAILF